MSRFLHSVTLEKDYCNGCTNCLHVCPTQAIRVRAGKAEIITERCIDCGACIKACPYHAKGALSDSLDMLSQFKFNVALPAISLYGQFGPEYDINRIFNGFYDLGFDYVYDVGVAAELLTDYQFKKLHDPKTIRPMISTYCPAVIRLIQVKYPTLIENIINLESPLEVAGRMARRKIMEMTNLSYEDIGVFYITQCPAAITSIRKPIGIETSCINGAISIEAVYTKLLRIYDDIEVKSQIQKCSGKGVGWAMVGGQSYAMGIDNYLAVDGVNEVVKVLDQFELGKLNDIDFFEGYACVTGCVGGPLNAENPFIAKTRVRKIMNKDTLDFDYTEYVEVTDEMMEWHVDIEPNSVMKLDKNFKVALEKMAKIEELIQVLPGIDCGACGAPTCRALAEDIVMGRMTLDGCVVQNRKK